MVRTAHRLSHSSEAQAIVQLVEFYEKQALERCGTCLSDEIGAAQGEYRAFKRLLRRVKQGITSGEG